MIGRKAPDFCLKNSSKEDVCLKDFLGKKVVIYFYPKDNTPGCTLEAIDFTRIKLRFEEKNATIIGISKDSCESHEKFEKNKELSITLLSDPEHKVQEAYGVWGPKKFMGREFLGTKRTTILIDESGVVEKIWENVNPKGHAQEVLNFIS